MIDLPSRCAIRAKSSMYCTITVDYLDLSHPGRTILRPSLSSGVRQFKILFGAITNLQGVWLLHDCLHINLCWNSCVGMFCPCYKWQARAGVNKNHSFIKPVCTSPLDYHCYDHHHHGRSSSSIISIFIIAIYSMCPSKVCVRETVKHRYHSCIKYKLNKYQS